MLHARFSTSRDGFCRANLHIFCSPYYILIKFSVGLSATLLAVAGSFCWWIGYKRKAVSWLVTLIISFVATFAILSGYLLGPDHNWIVWLKRSFEIVFAYSDADSLGGLLLEPVTAVVILAAYLLGLLILWCKKSELFLPACITGMLLLFSFKHSFVRQDWGHLCHFTQAVLVGLAYLFLMARARSETRAITALFLISLLIF